MYIAWINTITLGGGHKAQAVVQEVSAVTDWKGIWKSACGLFPLLTATPSSVHIRNLAICWKGQHVLAVTSKCVTRQCPSSATSTVQAVSTTFFRSWISPNSLVSFQSSCVWPLTLIQLFHPCPLCLSSPNSWKNYNSEDCTPPLFF